MHMTQVSPSQHMQQSACWPATQCPRQCVLLAGGHVEHDVCTRTVHPAGRHLGQGEGGHVQRLVCMHNVRASADRLGSRVCPHATSGHLVQSEDGQRLACLRCVRWVYLKQLLGLMLKG